jgi:hypothetical protein
VVWEVIPNSSTLFQSRRSSSLSNNEGLGCETPSIHNRLQQVMNSWNCHWAMPFWWQCRQLASESINTSPEQKEELYQRWCSSKHQGAWCGFNQVQCKVEGSMQSSCSFCRQIAWSEQVTQRLALTMLGLDWNDQKGFRRVWIFISEKVEVSNTNC